MTSLLLQIAFDEAHVISRWHKTDFLALRLFGDGNAKAAGDVANFLLREFTERKICARELFLREAEEKI